MARYRTTIQTKKSPEEAFEYLADFANAREWDPGVVEGEYLTGQPRRPRQPFPAGVPLRAGGSRSSIGSAP